MIMLPHTIEQKMISERVMEMGLGTTMNINKITSSNLYENAKKLISDYRFKKQALKYQSIFSDEEKVSHINAVEEIFSYIDQQN
jgi:UDP:flavonoid glycosyltransferase YjiC (YdhE family)